MGNTISEEEQLKSFVEQVSDGPDLGVDQKIVKFCSPDSSENLKRYYEKRKMETGNFGQDAVKKLSEMFVGLTFAPELAGLGALAIAVLIDLIFLSPSKDSTKEALRCVFAEEKASEVWDQIDECLKRCTMNIKNKVQLRTDIERIEYKLSEALTKLKNSMVRDGQMTSEALKAWINGAAFHIQMLIHLVRLGGIPDCDPVERLISTYKRDLDPLFRKHKEMIYNKCSGDIISMHDEDGIVMLVGEDSRSYTINDDIGYDRYYDVYYDHRYGRQKSMVQRYFNDVRENLHSLVHQRGSFSVY